jgi:DNA-binding beta-propeller fold protein YncE
MFKKTSKIGILAVFAIAALLAWQGVGVTSTHAQGDDGWTTDLATSLGVTLLQEFDSSGPAAWDPAANPNVFITTEGPGYGGLLSGVEFPGIAIIDSTTQEVVASQSYDLAWDGVFEPHGLGVSSDGQWIYLPSGVGTSFGGGGGRLLIIDAYTLKLNKVLGLGGRVHHAKSFINGQGQPMSLAYGWGQPSFVMDPLDDNRIVGGLTFGDQGAEGYLYFIDPAGEFMYVGGRLPNRSELHQSLWIKVSTETWEVVDNITVDDNAPIWAAFTADGKFAYFSGGHSSQVFQYDIEAEEMVGYARAGVEGPYGIVLNWDETEIYTVGKGEGSHNRGKAIGFVQISQMQSRHRASDLIVTNCVRGDHATLHPDPDLNQIWISCNSSFELVVVDLDLKEVISRIPMPNGGSTHSGSFVQYSVEEMGGFIGEVLSDQNGLQGSALALKRELLEGH